MKRPFLRICSFVLSAVLLGNMLPLTAPVNAAVQAAPGKEAVTQTNAPEAEAYVVAEIPGNRTKYSKEFLMSNGLHMTAVYPTAVHFLSGDTWAEIDNTLLVDSDKTIRNTAGIWDVRFPQQLTGEISVEKDGQILSFSMDGELTAANDRAELSQSSGRTEAFTLTAPAKSTAVIAPQTRSENQDPEALPDKNQSQLRYGDVYQDTSVVYALDSNILKENVVLDAYRQDLRGYQYTLNIRDMTPVVQEDGSIFFYAGTDEAPVMVMPAPYLLDDNGIRSDEIAVTLTGTGSTRTLTYLLPTDWLGAADRAWPVVMDPIISADLSVNNIGDRTVTEYKTYSQTWGMNSCGYDTDTGIQRFYLMYHSIPALTSSDVIVDAHVSMRKQYTSSATATVEIHSVSTQWDSASLTWENKPEIGTAIEDYAIVKNAGWYSWSVTDIVRSWYTGTNTGMAFKTNDAVETGGTANYKQFFSSDYGTSDSRPSLVILFRNDNGLESYWDYTSVSAGKAGTGYVNNYTGSLTWVRTDIGFSGLRMPVSVSHIYNMNEVTAPSDQNNANDTAGNYFGVGNGWRTNFHQVVYRWSESSNYYVWEDSDGTDHYFAYRDGQYRDEDGLELTLTTNGTGNRTYCIRDPYGNCSYFDGSGRLTAIENNQKIKSAVTVTYRQDTPAYIAQVTDGIGRTYLFDYENDLLQSIRFMPESDGTEESRISFGYNGTNLETVTYKDGSQCHYGYNSSGMLSTATDVDGYQVSVSCTTPAQAWQPSRVQSICEAHNGRSGGELHFAYAHNQTTVTDFNGNRQVLQFNSYGNLTGIQDDEGRAQYAQFARNSRTDTGRSNQLSASSKLQNTVTNLIKDGSFESSNSLSDWSFSNTGVQSSRTTDTAYAGEASMLLDYSNVTAKTYAFGPSFQLQPGETVVVSAYAKADAGTMSIALRKATTGKRYDGESLTADGQWHRIQIQLTNTEAAALNYRVSFVSKTPGIYYIDGIQAEIMPTPSRYNLIENGDFSFGSTPAHLWTGTGLETGDQIRTVSETAAPQLSKRVFAMTGNPTGEKHLTYTLNQSGTTGDSYVFSGWAQADRAAPEYNFQDTDNPREFNITLTIHYTNGETGEATAKWNPSSNTWQYTAGAIVAQKDYSSLSLTVRFDHNINSVLFDGIGLYKEPFSTAYTYDENGNLISVTDLQNQTTSYEYDQNNNVTQVIQNNKAKMTYEYDEYHNVIKATTEAGYVYTFQYDDYGNNISTSAVNGEESITAVTHYATDGNSPLSTLDPLNRETSYGYNSTTGLLEWVQAPGDTEDTRTVYTYDSMYRISSIRAGLQNPLTGETGQMSVVYGYENSVLHTIQTPTVTYTLNHGSFGLRESVQVGEQVLASYLYQEEETDDRRNDLDVLSYGNGDQVRYDYDEKGRLILETYEDGTTVSYTYDNSGNLATQGHSASGITTTYSYDLTDRLMQYAQSGGSYTYRSGFVYDTLNNLTRWEQVINGTTYTTDYTYDEDNRITGVTEGPVSKVYTYDGYGRSSQQQTAFNGTTVKTDSYTFQNSETGTTFQIQSHTVTLGSTTTDTRYTYDLNGNITAIIRDDGTVTYTYDSANQLIREEKAGAYRHSWTYDNAGNILSRTEETWTGTGWGPATVYSYTYGNSAWGDQLTAYNGQPITYDPIGNPLTDGTRTYTWQHGRQLASMTVGNTTWRFSYDAEGLRTQKTDGTTTWQYLYSGGQLVQMTKGNSTIHFTYDLEGRPLALTLNGTVYYYVTNLQGDVLAIADETGNVVVRYSYDAWGNLLSVTGTGAASLGTLNPLTYRGYVYDHETGLYYLQSRYYNPETGRFLNADGFVSTGQDLTGHNMYTYCGNNPVSRVDTTGKLWGIVPFIIREIIARANAKKNKEENQKKETSSSKNQIVSSQEDDSVKNLNICSGNVNDNGCGAVAIHNVKVLKGVDSTLTDTIYDIEIRGGFVAKGKLGMHPFVVTRVLNASGIACQRVSFEELQSPGLYLIMIINDPNDYSEGAHYIVVQYDGNTTTTYNGYNHPLSYYEDSYICGFRIE